MQAKLSTSSAATGSLLVTSLMLVLICHLGSNINEVEARYLPTRSDQSELDALKDIIKSVSMRNDSCGISL